MSKKEKKKPSVTSTCRKEIEIGVLMNPVPSFVSLVTRGANQTPFTVVKHDKPQNGGEPMIRKIIQAVITNPDTSVDDVRKCFTDEAGAALPINTEAPQKFTTCVKYEQVPMDKCKADTVELVVLDAEKGIKAITAEPVDGSGNIVTKLFRKATELTAVELPEDTAPMSSEECSKMLGEGVYDEFYALGDIIRGVLIQAEGTAKAKLSQCQTACGNFISYLETALTASKSGILAMSTSAPSKTDAAATETVEKVGRKLSKETSATISTIIASLTGLLAQPEDETTKTDQQEEESMKAEEIQTLIQQGIEAALKPVTDSISTLTQKVEEATGAVTAVKGEVETLKNTAPAPVKAPGTDEPPQKVVEKSEKTSKFGGVLFKS